MGVVVNWGSFVGDPNNKDYRILGSIPGSPMVGILPYLKQSQHEFLKRNLEHQTRLFFASYTRYANLSYLEVMGDCKRPSKRTDKYCLQSTRLVQTASV